MLSVREILRHHGKVLRRVQGELAPLLSVHRVVLQGHSRRLGASQSKITYVDTALACEQYILRFEVPVHNIGRVKEVHRAQEVVHNRYNVLLRKRVVLHSGEDAAQVLVKVLHDDEDVVEVSISVLCLLRWNHDVDQLGSE